MVINPTNINKTKNDSLNTKQTTKKRTKKSTTFGVGNQGPWLELGTKILRC